MEVLKKIFAFITPKKLRMIEVTVAEHTQTRKQLDERLNKILEATLNGESEWFLKKEVEHD